MRYAILIAVFSRLAAAESLSRPDRGRRESNTLHKPALLPRTPDGKPDLQGIWTNGTMTPLERPRDLAGKEFLTEDETAAREKRLLENLSTDRRDGGAEVDVGRSYNELWRERGSLLRAHFADHRSARRKASLRLHRRRRGRRRHAPKTGAARGPDPADTWEDRNLAERCITRGAPKLPGGYNNNFQIIQTRNSIAILQEMIHEVRYIPLDGRPHADSKLRLWMGDSRGHWEGDTLVVDTTNFNDKIVSNSFNCCPNAGSQYARRGAIQADRRPIPLTISTRWTIQRLTLAPGPLPSP